MAEQVIILGISPGTRFIGFSLFSHGSPFDAGIKMFSEKWSQKKLQKIIREVEKLCIKWEVKVIAIKIPDRRRSSKKLDGLIYKIISFAKEHHIKVVRCIRQKMGRIIPEHDWTNDRLMEVVAKKFPEFAKQYQKEVSCDRSYYLKMFEAVACGLLCRK